MIDLQVFEDVLTTKDRQAIGDAVYKVRQLEHVYPEVDVEQVDQLEADLEQCGKTLSKIDAPAPVTANLAATLKQKAAARGEVKNSIEATATRLVDACNAVRKNFYLNQGGGEMAKQKDRAGALDVVILTQLKALKALIGTRYNQAVEMRELSGVHHNCYDDLRAGGDVALDEKNLVVKTPWNSELPNTENDFVYEYLKQYLSKDFNSAYTMPEDAPGILEWFGRR